MITRTDIHSVLTRTKHLIHSSSFKEEYCIKENAFSRNRKLSFSDVILFVLGMPRKSLPTELELFFEKRNINISKQAFSKARYHISEKAFKRLFQESANPFGEKEPALWNDYRIFAIDGSTITVPHNSKTAAEFGIYRNNHSEYPMGRASVLYDITNDIIVDAQFTGITSCEREHAYELMNSPLLNKATKYQNLFIFDRGYPSRDLIHELERHGYSYLMRCSHSFLGCVNECPEGDHIVYDEYKGKQTKLRVIKTNIDSDSKQILVSNLFDEKQDMKHHQNLYRMRWGIETKYGELKTRLRIENYSGKNPCAVYQEFYAALFISNMAAIIKTLSETEVGENMHTHNHKYQLNRSYIIGLFARSIRYLLTSLKMFELLIHIIEKAKCLKSIVRENRHFKRNKNHHDATNGFYIRVTV
ncbi:IS4 family transposase [Lachnospiraceae bacterium ZAX-1]